MKKRREKYTSLEAHQPISKFIREHKGRRFILDCGHKAILADSRSNTIILTADGKPVCHQCGC